MTLEPISLRKSKQMLTYSMFLVCASKFSTFQNFSLKGWLWTVILTLGLSGCGQMTVEIGKDITSSLPLTATPGTYKIGKPYQIKGVWYTPQESFDWEEEGLASWYGPDFHGKPTANGEIFDMNEIVAAHKTLQLPCAVRVFNLDNGRFLDVRVNDRGPFVDGRIIDLSKKAAHFLGVLRSGLARVRIQVLKEESLILKEKALSRKGKKKAVSQVIKIPPSRRGIIFIEIGSSFKEAAQVASKLETVAPTSILPRGQNQHYKVSVGPVHDVHHVRTKVESVLGPFYKIEIW